MAKYHYFYKITNLINNHFYYGVHNTDNLDDGYMGSGTRLALAYEKYGVENFKKEILKYFDTSKDAFEYEAEVVNENLVDDDNCYNLVNGGREGWNTKNLLVVKKKNELNFYYISVDEYNKNKDLYITTWTGKHHTQEQKDTVRNKMTPKNSTNPRIWINKNGVVKYIRKELLSEFQNNGWELGRTGYKPRKNSQGKIIEI